MSRIGKKVRTIPQGVTLEIKSDSLTVKGPKGTLSLNLHPRVTIQNQNGEVSVTVVNPENTKDRSLWGTFSSILENMLEGVTTGYKKQLEINGVGYKAALKGTDLVLEVGFSHPVVLKAPTGIKFEVEKNVITVSGPDKQMVGEVAAQVRSTKKVEPYKGKGIKYIDEVVKRKAGKTAAKSAS